MPGSLLCRIVNGLTSCRAYFLYLLETHEEWVEWTCENFIGTRVIRPHPSQEKAPPTRSYRRVMYHNMFVIYDLKFGEFPARGTGYRKKKRSTFSFHAVMGA